MSVTPQNFAFALAPFPNFGGELNQYVTTLFSYNSPFTNQVSIVSATDQTTQGFLSWIYTPQVSDYCMNMSRALFPGNYTSLSGINPNTAVAYFPWLPNTNCSYEFLSAASANGSAAAVTFLSTSINPSQPYANAGPPSPTDPIWDEGMPTNWRNSSGAQLAVYAINAQDGAILMNQTIAYSGISAPTQQFGSYSYTGDSKVVLQLSVAATTSGFPIQWAIVLILIVGCAVVVVLLRVCFVYNNRRRRQQLTARIANGEIDLEHLGVTRLKVPQKEIERMQLYVYQSREPNTILPKPESALLAPVAVAVPETAVKSADGTTTTSTTEQLQTPNPESTDEGPVPLPNIATLAHKIPEGDQPTCAICLEDFESDKTIVRALRCRHIFHPACVDTVMLQHSSLCPICKKSVFLPGSCPVTVTDAMVRRERARRQYTQRQTPSGRRFFPFRRRPAAPPPDTTWLPNDAEMGVSAVELQPTTTVGTNNRSRRQTRLFSSNRRPANVSRAEWANQRANAVLNDQPDLTDEAARRAAQPMWRRALSTITGAGL